MKRVERVKWYPTKNEADNAVKYARIQGYNVHMNKDYNGGYIVSARK